MGDDDILYTPTKVRRYAEEADKGGESKKRWILIFHSQTYKHSNAAIYYPLSTPRRGSSWYSLLMSSCPPWINDLRDIWGSCKSSITRIS